MHFSQLEKNLRQANFLLHGLQFIEDRKANEWMAEWVPWNKRFSNQWHLLILVYTEFPWFWLPIIITSLNWRSIMIISRNKQFITWKVVFSSVGATVSLAAWLAFSAAVWVLSLAAPAVSCVFEAARLAPSWMWAWPSFPVCYGDKKCRVIILKSILNVHTTVGVQFSTPPLTISFGTHSKPTEPFVAKLKCKNKMYVIQAISLQADLVPTLSSILCIRLFNGLCRTVLRSLVQFGYFLASSLQRYISCG